MAADADARVRALFINVKEGGIFVPASCEYLTTYVLLEQEDWFEKEIRYVRRILEPAMRVIDVGALGDAIMVHARLAADDALRQSRDGKAASAAGDSRPQAGEGGVIRIAYSGSRALEPEPLVRLRLGVEAAPRS